MFCTPAETVKARKAHKCTYCAELIKPGELYDTWKSVDGAWFTNKMHSECHAELSEIGREYGEYEYSAYDNERPQQRDSAMMETKPWEERAEELTHSPYVRTAINHGCMLKEIAELRARLAQQAEMVEKCMVAMNENADRGMKAEKERDELRAALSKSKAELDEWRFTNKIDEMQREIERLSAHVAKSQPVEQGEPVAKVVSSGPADFPILQWISAELSLSTKTGDLLYTHPVRPMSDEPRYTVDQIADAACHAEVNDSKFESMCVYLGGIKGATA